jgi:hypothetical protein
VYYLKKSFIWYCNTSLKCFTQFYILQVSISGVGDLTFWEFSGQDTYFFLYDHFLGSTNSLQVVVFSLEDSPNVQYQQCCFWLTFLQARIPPTEPLGNIIDPNEISANILPIVFYPFFAGCWKVELVNFTHSIILFTCCTYICIITLYYWLQGYNYCVHCIVL